MTAGSVEVVVRDLSVAYPPPGVRALDRVSLRVAAGERVGLLGPSGAGKSTLLRALLGAVPATGTVRVGGLDPYGPGRRLVRRCTGFVRQDGDLVVAASARLNAILGTACRWGVRDWCRVAAGRVPPAWAGPLAALAERHGLSGHLSVPVGQLSGGQRRRVALVRALLPGPGLLLADEPTTGLDPVTAAEAVRALHDSAATVLAATHDPAVAATFPRVLGLRDGVLVYDGPPGPTAAARLYHDGRP